MISSTKKGFTLIELLVVIAIIAVLAVAVILTLNPAELLRQARDTTRVSDLNTLKSAISLYITDQSSAAGYSLAPVSLRCYQSIANQSGTCPAFLTQISILGAAGRLNNGTGWLPIDFTKVTTGAPIGSLPADPSNNSNFFYAYISSSTSNTFKLAAPLESLKYASSGVGDLEGTDGGTSPQWYETGTNLSL